jgi:ribosome-associated protein
LSKTLTSLAKKKLAVSALEDIKAHDILAIDVRKITSMFDWLIVASADSARQTKALARNVRDKLKEAGCAIIGTEGEEGAEWVLVDSGDIVVHVMQPAVRAYYNLEELWADGKFDRPAAARKPAVAAKAAKPATPAKPAAPRKRATPRKPAATGEPAAGARPATAPKPRRRRTA